MALSDPKEQSDSLDLPDISLRGNDTLNPIPESFKGQSIVSTSSLNVVLAVFLNDSSAKCDRGQWYAADKGSVWVTTRAEDRWAQPDLIYTKYRWGDIHRSDWLHSSLHEKIWNSCLVHNPPYEAGTWGFPIRVHAKRKSWKEDMEKEVDRIYYTRAIFPLHPSDPSRIIIIHDPSATPNRLYVFWKDDALKVFPTYAEMSKVRPCRVAYGLRYSKEALGKPFGRVDESTRAKVCVIQYAEQDTMPRSEVEFLEQHEVFSWRHLNDRLQEMVHDPTRQEEMVSSDDFKRMFVLNHGRTTEEGRNRVPLGTFVPEITKTKKDGTSKKRKGKGKQND